MWRNSSLSCRAVVRGKNVGFGGMDRNQRIGIYWSKKNRNDSRQGCYIHTFPTYCMKSWSRHGGGRRVLVDGKDGVWKGVMAICVLERLWESQQKQAQEEVAQCDAMIRSRTLTRLHHPSSPSRSSSSSSSKWKELKRKAVHALRLFSRVVKLLCCIAPIVALYPVQRLLQNNNCNDAENNNNEKGEQDAHQTFLASLNGKDNDPMGWYHRLCLYCVECSGAAVIKLMQWASSRPDLFGKDFCRAFSKLQDDTTPHPIQHTHQVLRQAYGDNWHQRIQLDPNVVGSGCIGQVYKGKVLKDVNGNKKEKEWLPVAIKVMHPNVVNAIADDLDLLRLALKFTRSYLVPSVDIFAKLRWMNPEGVIEEFADLLQLQLDLRTEAKNLKRFQTNFQNDPHIAFPQLIEGYEAHEQILIESFCEGIPVLKFVKEHQHDQKLLSQMGLVGVKAVCQMLFLDNFMHGDLHPGNVFINAKEKKFILLDAGIATEYSDADHELIVNILSSFIRQDGRRAGRLMIDDSNRRAGDDEQKALNEELYIEKIKQLTDRANGKDYFMEHLAVYLSYICESAAKHHVMMNQKFVTTALTVQVLEGMSLALDPSIEIVRVANPIILKTEMNRRWSKASRELVETLGLAKFMYKNQDTKS